MIAWNVDYPSAFARLTQNLLHHVDVLPRPIPVLAQPPAVDDVAEQVCEIGIVVTNEIEQESGLATARTQVDVRKPDCPVPVLAKRRHTPRPCDGPHSGKPLRQLD